MKEPWSTDDAHHQFVRFRRQIAVSFRRTVLELRDNDRHASLVICLHRLALWLALQELFKHAPFDTATEQMHWRASALFVHEPLCEVRVKVNIYVHRRVAYCTKLLKMSGFVYFYRAIMGDTAVRCPKNRQEKNVQSEEAI